MVASLALPTLERLIALEPRVAINLLDLIVERLVNADLNEQLQDLFRVMRHEELIWKSDVLLKRTSRQGFRRSRPKRGNGS